MMKVSTSTVLDIMSRMRQYFQKDNAFSNSKSEIPFRSELYSFEQMDRHGKILASSHELQRKSPSDQLLKRLEDNEKKLLEVRNLLVESIRLNKTVTPGAEWLLDNFYLIEEQVVIARKHLPKGYSEGLPNLANGNSAGLPRVYDIVLEIISHSDGRVDIKNLSSFIVSYQIITQLTLGELWAIPIMLRIAVIENLRRVSRKIALDMIDQNLADYWAEKMMTTIEEDPGDLILTVADMARSKPVLSSPFVACFTRRLQGKGPSLGLPLNWMEQQLTSLGLSSIDLVLEENQKQAVDQISVRNSIGTLRFLGATDWREFVETLSSVDQILRQDLTGTYSHMDFATRDMYRHVIERIAKSSNFSESEVAQKVLDLAGEHPESNQKPSAKTDKKRHLGYYLVDKGISQLEQVTQVQFSIGQKILRLFKPRPVFIYLFSIVFLTIALAGGMYYLVYDSGIRDWILLSVVGFISLSGAAQFSISLVNWIATIWVKPRLLPRMDFSRGIPVEFRTLVVVPTLLTNKKYIEDLVEDLEIRFLANKDENLHFGLLTDFIDAEKENLPEDESLLEFASAKIEALNKRYKQSKEDIFFLFHRPRIWNSRENKWMGYERKRGKLGALNSLLLGHKSKEFSFVCGDYGILVNRVKYVITLDSDTQLPRESAWKFVATMAHPLNHPLYDAKLRRVIQGYGILQPRVASAIPSTYTLYLRMLGNVSGIDPYTRMVSDVYQDLFDQGSFIGKGIYDVEIFEKTLHSILPENRILSHDLLEGNYLRSGLMSDVVVYEENPSQYKADVKRQHRWVRGDWQVGAWALPFVTGHRGNLMKNKLSALSRWKILDNLRRSILPVSLLLILILGWTVLPFPWFWTLAATFIISFVVMAAAGWQLMHKPEELSTSAHLAEVGVSVRKTLLKFIFDIAVLPYEAYYTMDAIIRTNWRMVISKRNLLEWTPSVSFMGESKNNVGSTYLEMWIAPLLGIGCTIYFLLFDQITLLVSAPFLILWIFSPALVWRLSKPEIERDLVLPKEQLIFLNKSARRSWGFFEQFVRKAENWLPPDNFQEQPTSAIAHRTSPTNIGLALLANLTAYDFGFISGGELVSRCNNTFQSMKLLDRHKGHFYNWYDTQTLITLKPEYISTVDSGNLAGHLLILKQGLLALPAQPIFSMQIFEGLHTTLNILLDVCKGIHSEEIKKAMVSLKHFSDEDNLTLEKLRVKLDELLHFVTELVQSLYDSESGLYTWANKFKLQVEHIQEDLNSVVPWIDLMPIPPSFSNLAILDQIHVLSDIPVICSGLLESFDDNNLHKFSQEDKEWLTALRWSLDNGRKNVINRMELIDELAWQCEEFSDASYDFLFDKSTNLLRIGFNVEEQRLDQGYYDLLASEARLGIFVGIAQGKLPQESWFALGRLLTKSTGDPVLLSWSGSMFEYLMPQLVMPTFENTLLHQTGKATVKRQIEYGQQRGVPWGISESGYNTVDGNLIYQYRAFGVPGLGLKRGLEEDLVIAPYATMLALMVYPSKAASNLSLLAQSGFEGEFGFYEAIDYTSSRLQRGKSFGIVQSYMAHHQGMSLLSLAYVLLNKPMQKRFVSELRFQATLLLLQERIPRVSLFYAHTADLLEVHTEVSDGHVRNFKTANTLMPEIKLLGNGKYQVMISNSGAGYSRWKDITVTRWREDTTKDNYGIFCYIKDVKSGQFWSNTYQPTLQSATDYQVIFSQGHVEFRRKDCGIETKTEIVISPEDDTEMRKVKLTNKTQSTKVLEITSYAEIVLASQDSDEAHPAFSNLFVQTQILQDENAILCTRRPRSEDENPPWMFHLMNVYGSSVEIESVSYETDRMQFIGRARDLVAPQAMEVDQLSGRQGAVLDPILSIRYRISIKAGHSATIDMIYGIGDTKGSCVALMQKYKDLNLRKRAFELSWTHIQVLLRQINVTEGEAQLYDSLAASIIYSNPNLRAGSAVIQSNFRGQSGLWSHSVSGDLPIILLHINDPESLDLVKQLVQAHAYWRLKGLAVDLVIWNEDYGSYRQFLQENIVGLINTEALNQPNNLKSGKIFAKSADQLSTEDRILFESVARVIIHDKKGPLVDQVRKHYSNIIKVPLLERKQVETEDKYILLALPENLLFFNGTGGFTPNGKEYKILSHKKNTTPVPWANILANPDFGSVITESGSSYTWAVNAHEYRITPWNNDPIIDEGGEAFYLRDEVTGNFWSPSPFPVKGKTPYVTTHGFGYSIFDHIENGISSKMTVYVDKVAPVKFIILKLKNISGREREISATGFMELILGDLRSKTNMHIVTEFSQETGALLFRNRYNSAFSGNIGFFKVQGGNQTYTSDRAEFIGRNRNLRDPSALYRTRLSGKIGAGLDPCAALQVKFDLFDGEEKELVFQLGSGSNMQEVMELIHQFDNKSAVDKSKVEEIAFWEKVIEKVQVVTPDPALNILANGWLVYQTMACRLFARSGFYQSGGAIGFRDQLQDVLALLHTRPDLGRNQILISASRQFVDGDVQHWWHPPEGRGVRTKCSDDLLWLPFVVAKYISATGDRSLLLEKVGYLESRQLYEGEDSLFDLPSHSNLVEPIYDHCVKAIKRSLQFGDHGLPLIGSGDWNDGMDKVGHKGKGESIWLGFFLFDVLESFEQISQEIGDAQFALTCKQEAVKLRTHLEKGGWDGEWYRRAYFDDGTPLGSKQNEECRIDAIAQSWSVLSGAGIEKRKLMAMDSLYNHLVRKDLRLIQLLDPPFDKKGPNPGYIRGYVPGVRENGGQYSHAAIWTLMAFSELKEREKVWELFSMIHPIGHALDPASTQIYKVEPYVMAADVYANESHKGRGGWTWYTGSAGWMYQFILGSLLGLELKNNMLNFKPCFPLDWPSVSIRYQFGQSTYQITLFQSLEEKESWWKIGSKEGKGTSIPLEDDGQSHEVEVHVHQ